MLLRKLLRRPLNKGDGYSGCLSSRAPLVPLFCSRIFQGRMLYHQLVQAQQIIASIVGVPPTLPDNAPKSGSLIKARVLTRTIETRARSRLSKSDREGLISPCLLIFPRMHHLWWVHSLSTTSLQLYYSTPVHHIVLLVQKWVWIFFHTKGLYMISKPGGKN